jgi:hypothetical protein
LPKDIFPESDEEKILNMADESLEDLEQGQDVYDEETKKEKTDDYANDSPEDDEESEEELESEEENDPKKKNDDEELSTSTPKTTTKKIETTTKNIKVSKSSDATTQRSSRKSSSSIESSTIVQLKKSTQNSPKIVPHLNIDGTQIAFNPKFNTTITPETTTERELEINDIADMIFPDRKNSTGNDSHVRGTNEAFEDKRDSKGAASGFESSLLTLLLCMTCLSFFL